VLARTKGEAKVTLMAAATMRACKSPYLALSLSSSNISSPRAGGISKQARFWRSGVAIPGTRTTIGNCCEKKSIARAYLLRAGARSAINPVVNVSPAKAFFFLLLRQNLIAWQKSV
jgi:hypothetical protein